MPISFPNIFLHVQWSSQSVSFTEFPYSTAFLFHILFHAVPSCLLSFFFYYVCYLFTMFTIFQFLLLFFVNFYLNLISWFHSNGTTSMKPSDWYKIGMTLFPLLNYSNIFFPIVLAIASIYLVIHELVSNQFLKETLTASYLLDPETSKITSILHA